MSIKKWLEKNTRELNGEVIAITGGTGGLGRECVKILSQLNAEIILLDRNLEKGNSLIKEIKKLNPLCKISQIPIDLGVVDSLKNGINQIKLLPRLDTLILNAGVFRAEGKNGEYREEFITNFVSSFYLANSVVPLLKKSQYAKIVCVGSIAYRLAKLNFDDLDYQKSGKQIDIYGNSKRLLMASLSWLSKLNKDINFFCPRSLPIHLFSDSQSPPSIINCFKASIASPSGMPTRTSCFPLKRLTFPLPAPT